MGGDGSHQVTDALVDHVEIYYPEDGLRHWVVNPGAVSNRLEHDR